MFQNIKAPKILKNKLTLSKTSEGVRGTVWRKRREWERRGASTWALSCLRGRTTQSASLRPSHLISPSSPSSPPLFLPQRLATFPISSPVLLTALSSFSSSNLLHSFICLPLSYFSVCCFHICCHNTFCPLPFFLLLFPSLWGVGEQLSGAGRHTRLFQR